MKLIDRIAYTTLLLILAMIGSITGMMLVAGLR